MKKLLFISGVLLTSVFGCGAASDGMALEEDFESNQEPAATYMTLSSTSGRLMVYEGE